MIEEISLLHISRTLWELEMWTMNSVRKKGRVEAKSRGCFEEKSYRENAVASHSSWRLILNRQFCFKWSSGRWNQRCSIKGLWNQIFDVHIFWFYKNSIFCDQSRTSTISIWHLKGCVITIWNLAVIAKNNCILWRHSDESDDHGAGHERMLL